MVFYLPQYVKMNPKLILASNSPRRQQLMREAGFQFTVRTLAVEEDFPPSLAAAKVAEYLAQKKGQAYLSSMRAEELIITADTTVVLEDQVLNKPADEEEAWRMLQTLSGNTHQVITGVCLTLSDEQYSFADTTSVTFRVLMANEIEYYIKHYQPFDKAGAYAIQEWIGMVGIIRIEGSYSNVVGLPLEKLYQALISRAVISLFPA